jgi:hypothetical protein
MEGMTMRRSKEKPCRGVSPVVGKAFQQEWLVAFDSHRKKVLRRFV